MEQIMITLTLDITWNDEVLCVDFNLYTLHSGTGLYVQFWIVLHGTDQNWTGNLIKDFVIDSQSMNGNGDFF